MSGCSCFISLCLCRYSAIVNLKCMVGEFADRLWSYIWTHRQTFLERPKDRQTDRKTYRQAIRQADGEQRVSINRAYNYQYVLLALNIQFKVQFSNS